MSFMKTGYEATNDPWKDVPGKNTQHRVWIKPGATERFIFLEDDPSCFWEHQYKFGGNWQNWEPCVYRNQMPGGEAGCPICDASDKYFPVFIGLHSVISMTPWVSKKGKRGGFGRKIYAARLGTQDNPGVLVKLRKLKEKHGRLKGLVFDITRDGKKSEPCGNDFDLVEKVEPDDIEKYGRAKIAEFLEAVNAKLPHNERKTVEEFYKKNPWTPINMEEAVPAMPIAQLRARFAGLSSQDGDSGSKNDYEDGGGSAGDSEGGDDTFGDDDIPY